MNFRYKQLINNCVGWQFRNACQIHRAGHTLQMSFIQRFGQTSSQAALAS